MKITFILILASLLFACQDQIKNTKSQVAQEEGTSINKETTNQVEQANSITQAVTLAKDSGLLGYWVGYFERDDRKLNPGMHPYDDMDSLDFHVDVKYRWMRENKITVSIEEIRTDSIFGKSVVAGNDRPFVGVKKHTDTGILFILKEPGNHKYDGAFIFNIHQDSLKGKWNAYKKIEVNKRKYVLVKKRFRYNSSQLLVPSKSYIEWDKVKPTNLEPEEEGWSDFLDSYMASASDKIYTVNASARLLAEDEVSNLHKGDLKVIRNTIYARHGYSFKNRVLRVFFDAQPWYMPVHTNIKTDFTEIEKKNIKLLLKYEENAEEYYDYFGRG